jgi:hypothetical protein
MTMAAKKKKHFLDEKGQGIIEFFLFLPFMVMMYSVLLSFSNAINASINQQKIARSYFYYRVQNNSMAPYPSRGGSEPSDAWSTFGMQIMGWAESFEGGNNKPVAPCFRMRLPLGVAETDACEAAYDGDTTQFIRVATVYGICGATWENQSGQRVRFPMPGAALKVIDRTACQITN